MMYELTVELKKEKGKPLYLQLYWYLVAEIQSGHLRQGERLPSKRSLASHLDLSQNTVETAYQMLVREGYVTARAKSGFYINPLDTLVLPSQELCQAKTQEPRQESFIPYDFHTGGVNVASFPFATWAKISKEVMYNNPELLSKGDAQGDFCLRQAIATYVHQFRGVNCQPEQVVVGAGLEYLMDLLHVMLPKESVFALENPGYFKHYNILKNHRRKMVFIPLDEKGLRLDSLEQQGGTVVSITPSHQFPTGRIMPVGRRVELLKWAYREPGRYIIEDDYDSEFSFSGKPIPAVQGLDREEKVIYLSTFSRTLAPSVRIAYMVLPPHLVMVYKDHFRYYSSTVSRFEQHTLARFISEGYYGRHLNRMRNIYKKRREELTKAAAELGLKVLGDDIGLHLLLPIPGANENEVLLAAQKAGIKLHGLSLYYLATPEKPEPPALVLGYAGIEPQQIREGMARLGDILKKEMILKKR